MLKSTCAEKRLQSDSQDSVSIFLSTSGTGDMVVYEGNDVSPILTSSMVLVTQPHEKLKRQDLQVHHSHISAKT
ncbi:hypothetical protein A6R68_07929 [Neotoma lepida]|uniref:Uncharacterized protein n=1 Tax=Neotoma lepida TaxID=56216 RepID=A0A1A6GBB1_NEOLE|nr:hypothetical protein A6R68_07929 [Neotoma lepida]